ncbi:hypothetical protein [Nitrosomonas marina]|uniref:hypothetical protein n=1 Tax=Nitrosomonas marina TaxID=917 RepID=UPI00115F9800|nr:hypothetical protein [Nitrosomonas marina]
MSRRPAGDMHAIIGCSAAQTGDRAVADFTLGSTCKPVAAMEVSAVQLPAKSPCNDASCTTGNVDNFCAIWSEHGSAVYEQIRMTAF